MRFGRALFGAGAFALVAACALSPSHAREAAFATWRPFVLVAGLLLVGVVAHDNGIFDALGRALARAPLGDTAFVVAGLLVVAAVTAVLNLDTAAAFLTPVLLLGAMHRGDRGGVRQQGVREQGDRQQADERLLYGSLLMCNAASLLLPGSNLTNLIVLSSAHRSAADFASAMWPAFVAAVAVTTVFVVWAPRRRHAPGAAIADRAPLARSTSEGGTAVKTRRSLTAVAATVVVVALMLALSDPAPAVLAVGLIAVAFEMSQRRMPLSRVVEAVDPAVLLGLFGVAVALGTLGRGWHWPSHVLGSTNAGGTAAIAAGASVLLNNLPSAALLAARPVAHSRALLVGLNLGPNLAVTGSLSALLWYRTARTVGARPRVLEVTRLGVVLVPLSIAAALLALHLAGSGAL